MLPTEILLQIALDNQAAYIGLLSTCKNLYELSKSDYVIILRNKRFATMVAHSQLTEYKLFGKLHRDDDRPAVITSTGSQHWYRRGQRHRDNDLPASVCSYGDIEWWVNGQRHRDGDLPAIIYANGEKKWFQHGVTHRDNEPAIIRASGERVWYTNGVRGKTICW